MDLTEAAEIKNRWQEYSEELQKKYLNDSDNHNVVTTHLESNSLEWEAKWASGSITTNTASTGGRTPAELFKTLKDAATQVLYSGCQ